MRKYILTLLMISSNRFLKKFQDCENFASIYFTKGQTNPTL